MISEREPEYNSNRYWVHAPIEWLTLADEDGFAEYYLFDQNKRKKRGLYSMTPEKCAKAWAAIIAETGIRDLHPPAHYVPDLVAARGQAYTVTYVYLTNVVPVGRVADRFDITKRTAREYIKDVSKRRR